MARKNGQMFSFSTKSFPWCFPLRCWCCCARDMPEKCWLKWSKHTLECQRHKAGDAACFLALPIVSLTLFVFLLVVLFFLLSRFDLISWVLLSQDSFFGSFLFLSLYLFLSLVLCPPPTFSCKCSHFNQMPANLLDSLCFPVGVCLLRVWRKSRLAH